MKTIFKEAGVKVQRISKFDNQFIVRISPRGFGVINASNSYKNISIVLT